MTVWRVTIDENGGNSSYGEFKTRKVIATGWCDLGSFNHLIGQPRSLIQQHAQTQGDLVYAATANDPRYWWFGTPQGHSKPYGGHRMHIGRIFDYFINHIAPGDLVLAHVGLPPVGIAEVCKSSRYFYDSSYEYANCWTTVKWVDITTAGIRANTCRFLGK